MKNKNMSEKEEKWKTWLDTVEPITPHGEVEYIKSPVIEVVSLINRLLDLPAGEQLYKEEIDLLFDVIKELK